MSMMWIGIAGVATSAIGTGASLINANSQKNASDLALAQQQKQSGQTFQLQQRAIEDQSKWLDYFKEAIAAFSGQAFEIADASKREVGSASRRSEGIINKIPEIVNLIDTSEELSRKDFDFRTKLKRENLDFVVGDNMEGLRDAQTSNTNIANLNSADFQGKFSDIVRSTMFGLKANTIGDPYGTLSNLSARNLYDFSQQGLSNALALNDFFSKEGTVDPVSPLATAFDLRTVAEREASMEIQNQQWRANSIAQVNSGLMGSLGQALGAQGNLSQMGIGVSNNMIGLLSNNLQNQASISNAGLIAQQTRNNAYVDAIGQMASTAGQAYGLGTQRMAVNNQTQFNNALIAQYSNNANTTRYSSDAGNISGRSASQWFTS